MNEDQEPDTDQEVCAVCCRPYEPHGFDGMGECPDCAYRATAPGRAQ